MRLLEPGVSAGKAAGINENAYEARHSPQSRGEADDGLLGMPARVTRANSPTLHLQKKLHLDASDLDDVVVAKWTRAAADFLAID